MIYSYPISNLEDPVIFSDDIAYVRQLLSHGKYAIPVLTSSNKGSDLSGFPYLVEAPQDLTELQVFRMLQRLQGQPWIIHQDPAFILREFTPSDSRDLALVLADPEIALELTLPLGRAEDLDSWIHNYISRVYHFFEFGLWGIEIRGRLVGIAGISPENNELGYGILPAFRGQGVPSRACVAILRFAAEELDLPSLTAKTRKSNPASIHILEKLGFTRVHASYKQAYEGPAPDDLLSFQLSLR